MISSLSDLLGQIGGGGDGSVDPLALLNGMQQQQQSAAGPAPIDPTGASTLPAAAPGNVLARLRSAGQQLAQAPTSSPFVYSGAPDVRGMSKGAALATGLSSGLRDLSQASMLRQQMQAQSFQNQLALYKELFDIQNQQAQRQLSQDTLAETRRKDLAAEDPVLQGKLATARSADASSKWTKIGEKIDPDTGTKMDVMGYPPPAPSDSSSGDADEGGPKKQQITAEEYLKRQGVDNTSPPKTRGMMQQDLGNEAGAAGPSFQLPDEQKARLNDLDPNVANHVEAILQGRETMPKIPSGGRLNPFSRAISNGVFAVNPQFDAVRNQAQVKTRQAFMPSGANNAPGTLIQNGDAALDHLSTLLDASRAMPNYGSLAGGAVSGAANITGGLVGGDYAKAQGDLDTKAQIAATEAIKYLAGTSSGGGVAEREKLMTQFSSAVPPEKREAAVKALAQDILEKKIELQAGWRRGMGPEIPDFDVISPNSIGSVKKLGLDSYFPRLGGSSAAAAARDIGAASSFGPAAASPVAPPQGTPPEFGSGGTAPAAPAAAKGSFEAPIELEDSDAGRAAAGKLPKGTWVKVPGRGIGQLRGGAE